MIDLHNHLLPGIDDGSPDLQTSLRLARMAMDEGVTRLVCTPHIHPGRFDNTAETIARARARFVSGLRENRINLPVATAAEVHFCLEIMQWAREATLPFVGKWQGQPVLLLELPHSQVPVGAERLTHWLIGQGIVPMIAHPERNRGFISSPAKLEPFLKQGCLLQLTSASLLGRFGRGACHLAETLLEADKITVLASDAHNESNRPPLFKKALVRAAALVGERRAHALVSSRPWHIAESLFRVGS